MGAAKQEIKPESLLTALCVTIRRGDRGDRREIGVAPRDFLYDERFYSFARPLL